MYYESTYMIYSMTFYALWAADDDVETNIYHMKIYIAYPTSEK